MKFTQNCYKKPNGTLCSMYYLLIRHLAVLTHTQNNYNKPRACAEGEVIVLQPRLLLKRGRKESSEITSGQNSYEIHKINL